MVLGWGEREKKNLCNFSCIALTLITNEYIFIGISISFISCVAALLQEILILQLIFKLHRI